MKKILFNFFLLKKKQHTQINQSQNYDFNFNLILENHEFETKNLYENWLKDKIEIQKR